MEDYNFRWGQEEMTKWLKTHVKPDVDGVIKWKRFTKQFYKHQGLLYPILQSINTLPYLDKRSRKKVWYFVSDLWTDIVNTHNCKCRMHSYPLFLPHSGDPRERALDYTCRIMDMYVNAETKILLHKILLYFTQIF